MNKIRVSSDKMYPYSAITPVPKGQVKFSKIQFYLSDDWDGRNTIAQFQQGEKTLNKSLNSDNTCYIPSDFDIGLVTVYLKGYGLDGFSIATANGVSIPIVQGAFDGGDPAVPPDPDLYQKLIQSIQQTEHRVSKLFEQAQTSADAAHRAQTAIENLGVSAVTLEHGASASVEKTESEGVVSLRFGIPQGAKGDQGEQGPRGETGPTGVAGYTPVRGTDYWTAEDQQAIVYQVLAAMPDGDEVGY